MTTSNTAPARGGHRASGLTGGTSSSFSDKEQTEPAASVYAGFQPELETEGIAGYTYRAEHWNREALIEQLIREKRLSPGARGMNGEDALSQLAVDYSFEHGGPLEFDREDEYTFDSDDFPKVIFGHMLDDDTYLTTVDDMS
jgi:hypothetical protein